jgi:hypothetical protein
MSAIDMRLVHQRHFRFPIVWKWWEDQTPNDFKDFPALHRVSCTCIYKKPVTGLKVEGWKVCGFVVRGSKGGFVVLL